MSALPFLALGLVGLVLLSKKGGGATNAAIGGPQPLRADVPYLFIVRLDVGVTDEQARAALEPKDVEGLVLSPALNPPFWAQQPGAIAVFSERLASFKATPKGNGSVTLGEPFYGIGRLESLARLDGQPFNSEGPNS